MFFQKFMAIETLSAQNAVVVDKNDLLGSYEQIFEFYKLRETHQSSKYYDWLKLNLDVLINSLQESNVKDLLICAKTMKASLLYEQEEYSAAAEIFLSNTSKESLRELDERTAGGNVFSQAFYALAVLAENSETAVENLMLSIKMLLAENIFNQELLELDDFAETLELFEARLEETTFKTVPPFLKNLFIDIKNYLVQLEKNQKLNSLVKFTQYVLVIKLIDIIVKYYDEDKLKTPAKEAGEKFNKGTINNYIKLSLEYFYSNIAKVYETSSTFSEIDEYASLVDPQARAMYLQDAFRTLKIFAGEAGELEFINIEDLIKAKDSQLQRIIDDSYEKIKKNYEAEYLLLKKKTQEQKEEYYRQQLQVLRYLIAHREDPGFVEKLYQFFSEHLPSDTVLPEQDIISWLALIAKLENYNEYLKDFLLKVGELYLTEKVKLKLAEVYYLRAAHQRDLPAMQEALQNYVSLGGRNDLYHYARDVYRLAKMDPSIKRAQLRQWLELWGASYPHSSAVELDQEFIWFAAQEGNKTKLDILNNIRKKSLKYKKLLEVLKNDYTLISEREVIDTFKGAISFSNDPAAIQAIRLELAQYLLSIINKKPEGSKSLEGLGKLAYLNFRNIKPKYLKKDQENIFAKLKVEMQAYVPAPKNELEVDKYTQLLLEDMESNFREKELLSINTKFYDKVNNYTDYFVSSLVLKDTLNSYYVFSAKQGNSYTTLFFDLFSELVNPDGKFKSFYFQVESESGYVNRINIYFVKSMADNPFFVKNTNTVVNGQTLQKVLIKRFELLELPAEQKKISPDLVIDFKDGFPVMINNEPFVVKINEAGPFALGNVKLAGRSEEEGAALLQKTIKKFYDFTEADILPLIAEADVLEKFRENPYRFIQFSPNALTYVPQEADYPGWEFTYELYKKGERTVQDVKNELTYLLGILLELNGQELVNTYRFESVVVPAKDPTKKELALIGRDIKVEDLPYYINVDIILNVFALVKTQDVELYNFIIEHCFNLMKKDMVVYDIFDPLSNEELNRKFNIVARVINDLLDVEDEDFSRKASEMFFPGKKRSFFVGGSLGNLAGNYAEFMRLHYPQYCDFKANKMTYFARVDLATLAAGGYLDEFFAYFVDRKYEEMKIEQQYIEKNIYDQNDNFKPSFVREVNRFPQKRDFQDILDALNSLYLGFFGGSLQTFADLSGVWIAERNNRIMFERTGANPHSIAAEEVYQNLLKKLFKYYQLIGLHKEFVESLELWREEAERSEREELLADIEERQQQSFFSEELTEGLVFADFNFKARLIDLFLKYLRQNKIITDQAVPYQRGRHSKKKKK